MLNALGESQSRNCKKQCWYGSMKVFYHIFSMILIMSSSLPYISEDRDNTGIPVACSKCNETFETDSDYVVHYNERHADNI
jgi:hypothetical protein